MRARDLFRTARAASRSDVEPLRLGIVGCGFVTRHRHVPTLRRLPEITVVGLTDVDPAATRDVAAALSDGTGGPAVRQYADVEQLVQGPEVEAIAVCVPVVAHADVVLAALRAGKHVFVEKPLALDLDEADRIIEMADRTRACVLVGFNLRWHRHLAAARRVVAAGSIGHVQAISTVFSDPLLARGGLPAWRSRRDQGGGVLFDKLAHHFDLWRFLLDDEPVEVFVQSRPGRGDDDTVSVTARMRGGALVTTLGMDDAHLSHQITLYGDRGGLHIDVYRFDGLVRSGVDDPPGAPRTRLSHLAGVLREPRANLSAIRRGGDFDLSYDGEWRHFADAARRDRAPACSAADGRAALAIALAADRSRSLGEPVGLDLTAERSTR
jgi:predicted dehydrogenase